MSDRKLHGYELIKLVGDVVLIHNKDADYSKEWTKRQLDAANENFAAASPPDHAQVSVGTTNIRITEWTKILLEARKLIPEEESMDTLHGYELKKESNGIRITLPTWKYDDIWSKDQLRIAIRDFNKQTNPKRRIVLASEDRITVEKWTEVLTTALSVLEADDE